MIKAVGYHAETHYSITEDGYILALHRIPRGRSEKGTGKLSGAVCYLQHGLMCSSADWVIPAPEKGLGIGEDSLLFKMTKSFQVLFLLMLAVMSGWATSVEILTAEITQN